MAMELEEGFIVAASCIGFISVCKAFINFVRWVWVMFLRSPKNLKDYGSWAIVTGSAQGIGKVLALELASKGLNLVLIDKNHSALEATSNEIHEEFGGRVEIKNMVIDLAKLSGKEIANAIEDGIRGLDVGVLINNAGIGYPYARFFHEVDLELMENIIKVNLGAVTWVTRVVLPGMLKKKKGAILNISSNSSQLPSFPLYTLYSTTKAYISMFSRCISLEYKQQGIDIQCQIPFFVATSLTKHLRGLSWFMSSPEKFSKASVRWIGYEPVCNPYWWHSVQWFILRVASPDELLNAIIYWICIRVRKRGQMKEAQSKKMHQQENAS
ncbi:putative very-long-chain 3-oxoacyl-CoA reductase [Rosa chinensis]|uniref:Putative very-long-chain 3-oxoacyl-CoA reductase n=1 Tax=Rosa chinensis TaxID=74649 RepID=A0A2P6R0W4_ROSCH|nr:very-long-chain 3-oxoacyl-CoA reductase 1 [Rosa chinensis]XP_024192690.1 very-long-chain 3-oxoacyl-CoA reductase 1 [Rosa chinensis]XP_024192691.1 very-long-chain 3-oxoacyl-CoA reductase 1 [Rosa chinensis]XP_024192692.1 very-long-chain 3-oxoacyl-CoA reductase 1 [Rosa chinensis]XP_024197028.1 very-long-chain 3-oxoacyl-CoA reductase 1 [Rosa chinensis]XP_024197029.1 very-long-chain 3-oxoacyl-CoA reductase 1 [Rosa chinensis]XP_024197030.1 very-long-chain 3-oxoacyl-CoA reductase 1 [Rosa chinensi